MLSYLWPKKWLPLKYGMGRLLKVFENWQNLQNRPQNCYEVEEGPLVEGGLLFEQIRYMRAETILISCTILDSLRRRTRHWKFHLVKTLTACFCMAFITKYNFDLYSILTCCLKIFATTMHTKRRDKIKGLDVWGAFVPVDSIKE